MVEEFFIRLSQGDVRSIIIALFICFVVFIIVRTMAAIYQKGKGYFQVIFVLFGILVIYGVFYFPHTVQEWFLTIADGLTAIIEPLFEDTQAVKN